MFHIQGTVHKVRTEKLLNLVFLLTVFSFPSYSFHFWDGWFYSRFNLSFLFPLTHTPCTPPHTLLTMDLGGRVSVCSVFLFNIQNSGLESATFPVLKPDTLTLYALWCLSHLLEMEYRKRQLGLGAEGKLITSVDQSPKTTPNSVL